jgi:2-polyprenyl-3-methyl-5-hydroxy-6-metoxy-1,4-benzoquinol methylase
MVQAVAGRKDETGGAGAGCLLCGGPLSPWLSMPLDAKTLRPTPYASAKRCEPCDLGVVDPLPTSAEIPSFYRLDAYYTHGASHFAKGEPVSLFDRVRTRLAWEVDQGTPLTADRVLELAGRPAEGLLVCDIGCGAGALISQLAKRGAAPVGVDPDETSVAAGRTNGLDIRLGAAEFLPSSLAPRSFDLAIMSHSLEHCLNPAAALSSVAGLLKPGGALICETPNVACRHFQRFTVVSEMYDAPRHLWFFTPKSLSAVIERAGLKIETRYFAGYTRLFNNDWRATERRIQSALVATGAQNPPPAHTRAQSWMLLAETMFAAPEAKYDSIGFVARAGAKG